MPIMIFMTRYYHSFIPFRRFISVIKNNFKTYFLLVFMAAGVFIISCEEEPTKIGNELLPSNDFVTIKSTDTLSVWSYTMYDDSVRSELPSVSYLGELIDPYFGTTTAEFVTEIRLGGVWDDKPFTIDSVRMYLTLLDASRISDAVHALKLSEISTQLNIDSLYYSASPIALTGYAIDNIVLPPLDSLINKVIINLPVEFGNYLTRDTSMFFYSNTKPDFRSYFKGLYFQMKSSSDPLLLALSLAPPATLGDNQNFIVLYMHDDADKAKEFFFVLDATNRNASFNKFTHNYSTADPDKKIKHINDGYKDSLSYIQYLNGVYTKLTFPGLAAIKNDPAFKNIVINKASLTIPVFYDGTLYKESTFPEELVLRYRTSSGTTFVVPEYYYDQSHNFFDGGIDTLKNVYNFNIPGFIQNYLNDKTGRLKPELELYQPSGTKNAILKANNSKTTSNFKLTYTRF
jgi:hypothetical protein